MELILIRELYTFLYSSESFKDYFCGEIFYVSLKFGFDFRRNYISVRCKVPNQKSHEKCSVSDHLAEVNESSS